MRARTTASASRERPVMTAVVSSTVMPTRTRRRKETLKAYGPITTPDGERLARAQFRYWAETGRLVILGMARTHEGAPTDDPDVVLIVDSISERPTRQSRNRGPWLLTDSEGGVWELAPVCGCSGGPPQPVARWQP